MTQRTEEIQKNPLLNDKKTIEVVERILSKNDQEANKLREIWQEEGGVYVINLMSSPGAGKTTLLEETAQKGKFTFGVIEGDLETNRDAERLEKVGVRAHQITTGTACHLEANMVRKALDSFAIKGLDYLFIENVGNLVCPGSYDLGAHLNVVLLSVPEGCDKVLKYPTIFRAADVVLITKMDLAPYFDYDVNRVYEDMAKVRPDAEIFEISTKDEASFQKWLECVAEKKKSGYTSNYIFP